MESTACSLPLALGSGAVPKVETLHAPHGDYFGTLRLLQFEAEI